MCSTVQEQITTCGQNAIVKIGERTNIRPQKVSTLYRCTGRSFTNSTQKQRKLLQPLNNLEKRILQKYKEPKVK